MVQGRLWMGRAVLVVRNWKESALGSYESRMASAKGGRGETDF